jgi:hypothetical protein
MTRGGSARDGIALCMTVRAIPMGIVVTRSGSVTR